MAPVVPVSATEDVQTTEVAADDLDPLVGVTLDGRFRVVGILGKGAMGRVYRAVQVPLNRAVALKVLDSNYGAGREEAFRQRFLVEAAMTAKLSHPNTIRIIDYGCSKDGIFYLAMEFLDGETLDRVLKRGPLPWRRALSIGQQTARALREAHELGVVHRDLKSANVMLLSADDDTDHVKVLDFGLVKSFIEGHELDGRAITVQGMLMGSPPYMAPEQGEHNRADPRSDIYSLGVVLYEELTGHTPFTGALPLEIILKHVNEPVPPIVTPRGFEPIPDGMKDLVMRCLAKSPMDRFQTMEEVLLAMNELAAPIPTPAHETPLSAESQIAIRTGPSTLVLVIGFVVTMALGISITAAVMHRPAEPEKEVVQPPPPVIQKAHPESEHDLVELAVPAKVVFHIATEPLGASVKLGTRTLGTTPLDVQMNEGKGGHTTAEFTLTKDGYLPLTVTAGGTGPRIELLQKLQPNPEPIPDKPPSVKEIKEQPEAPRGDVKAAKTPVHEQPAVKAKVDPKAAAIDRAFSDGDKKDKKKTKPASKLDDDDEAPPPPGDLKKPRP